MDVETVQRYLQEVETLIEDEEQIVTYKYLSRHLGIHVNASKQLLYEYWRKQKSKNSNISCNYLLAGFLKNESQLVLIVAEDKLKEAYSQFEEVTSEHIYSIQKGRQSDEKRTSQLLYVADMKLDPPQRFPIICKRAIKKVVTETKVINTVDLKKGTDPTELGKQVTNSKKSPPPKEKSNSKKGYFANFFNNAPSCKKVNTEGGSGETSNVIKESDCHRIFNSENHSKTVTVLQEKGNESRKVNEENRATKSKSNKVAHGKDKKNFEEKIKRKRIIIESDDSDSDEEKRDAELSVAPEVMVDETTRNTREEETIGADLFENKRKKRKTVDRTVFGEDGYMETIKEIIYETDSDEEKPNINVQAKKNESLGAMIGKNAKFQSTGSMKEKFAKENAKKQSTLFSYFKK